MIGPAIRRIAQLLVTLLAASVLVWALLLIVPGDPARRLLQHRHVTAPSATQLAAARAELGLDRPLPVRYGQWLLDALRGDLGTSSRSGRPVTEELARYLPATARLTLAALCLAMAASLLTGVLAAYFAGRWPDQLARLFALGGAAVPTFLVGLLLLEFVVLRGGVGAVVSDGSWRAVWLPAAALAWLPAARWSRLLRAGLVHTLRSELAVTSYARGASRFRILVVHGLRHAAVPYLAAVALTLGWLLGGTVVVEAVFSWPGIGSEVVEAVTARDLAVVQGFALVATLAWVAVSSAADLAAKAIDPRLREGGS